VSFVHGYGFMACTSLMPDLVQCYVVRLCHETCTFFNCRSSSLESNQASMDWK